MSSACSLCPSVSLSPHHPCSSPLPSSVLTFFSSWPSLFKGLSSSLSFELSQLRRENKQTFIEVLTEVPEWSTIDQAFPVLRVEGDVLKSASLEPHGPREGGKWSPKRGRKNRYQTVKSKNTYHKLAPRWPPPLIQTRPLLSLSYTLSVFPEHTHHQKSTATLK